MLCSSKIYNSILEKGEIGDIHRLRGIKTKLCKHLFQNKTLEQKRHLAICPLYSSDGYAKGFLLYFETPKLIFGTEESFNQEMENVEVKTIQDYIERDIPHDNLDMNLSYFDFRQIDSFVEIKKVYVSREDVLSNEEYQPLSSTTKHLSEEEKMDQLIQPRRFFEQNLRKTHSDSDSSKQLSVKKAQKPVRQKHEELLVKTTKLSEKKNDAQDITKLRIINLELLADVEERDLQLQEASKKYKKLQMEKWKKNYKK